MFARRPFADRAAYGLAASLAAVALLLFLHYSTALHRFGLHDLLRRLFYIPVITAAIAAGARGGLLTSLVAAVVYIPHLSGLAAAGAPVFDHLIELVLLPVIGALVGGFADAGRRARAVAGERAKLAALGEIGFSLMSQAEGPLASIDGQAESLRFLSKRREDRAVAFAADIVGYEVSRLRRLMADLVALGRASSWTATREDLTVLLAGVVSEIRMQHLSGMKIEIGSHSNYLPIRADRRVVGYALHSLLTGLLECVPPPARLQLTTREVGGTAAIDIVATFLRGEAPDLERNLQAVFGAHANDYRLPQALCVSLLTTQGATVAFRKLPPSAACVTVEFPRAAAWQMPVTDRAVTAASFLIP